MLIHVGEERSDSIDLALAAIMSAVAGALNAVGFQVAGLFSANMTGNVSALADHAATGDLAGAMAFGGLVVTFVTGATIAAAAIYLGEAGHIRQIYALIVLAEGMMLLALWAAPGAGGAIAGHPALIIALSFIMGVQNATTTMLSRARVRTTHVSGMATDIGIELAAMTMGSAARHMALPKLRLHSLTMACFALGGVAGTIIHALFGGWLFGITALALLAISVPVVLRALRPA